MDLRAAHSSSSSPATPPKAPQFNLQQAVNKLQNQCSSFFQHLNHHKFFSAPFFNPNPASGKFNFEFTLNEVGNDSTQSTGSIYFPKNPLWARITVDKTVAAGARAGVGMSDEDIEQRLEGVSVDALRDSSKEFGVAKKPLWARIAADKPFVAGAGAGAGMSNEDIEKRLAGVPVYALSNSSEEFVVVSGQNPGKSLGLLCFKEEDAKTLLGQMKAIDPKMRPGSKVVPISLGKVFQLKVNGVSLRFIPELSQIKNALEARRKAGVAVDNFSGVPVFQSRSLVLRSNDKKYRPAFFRKEDLEKSLAKASGHQRPLNPVLMVGDLEVAVLEDIIHGMKDDSTTVWDDVVFIPPGFDV